MLQSDEFYSSGNDANACGEFALAAENYRQALALVSAWPEAQHNLASVLYQLGQVDEAMDLYRRAGAGPNRVASRGMMAVIVPGSPRATNETILETRRDWARIITPPSVPFALRAAFSNGRPLRIGYMSSFFDCENYMKPVWALINRHNRSHFEIHLFSDKPRGRIQTAYRPHANDTFHYTGDLEITECAAQIESAQLDILIDLNAYSRWRRLPVYSLRPAPIIATWFNSYATTGMPSIDYLIGDAVVAPPEEERFYSEKILRVDGSYLTFEVTYPVPEIAPPPCCANRRITFGCLAPLYKITPLVIAAWSKILHGAPDSTLLLKNTAFKSAANREFLLRLFAQHQIPKDRLQLEGPSDHFEFLQAYSKIDIALDTFPYNGGTTTTEAIWQGVPVLTFYGDRWASRTSASILRAGNLSQFVVNDLDGYIETAVHLANDLATPDMLEQLRRSMRDRLTASAACDAQSFANQMEALYRQMYASR